MLRSAGRGLLSRVANLQRCAAKQPQQQQLVNLNRAPALSPSPRWVSTTSSVLSGHSGRGSVQGIPWGPLLYLTMYLSIMAILDSFIDECRDVLDVNPSRVHGGVVGDSGLERMCMCEETLADITPRAFALQGSLVD